MLEFFSTFIICAEHLTKIPSHAIERDDNICAEHLTKIPSRAIERDDNVSLWPVRRMEGE